MGKQGNQTGVNLKCRIVTLNVGGGDTAHGIQRGLVSFTNPRHFGMHPQTEVDLSAKSNNLSSRKI